jgi:hypothetical protein
MSINGDYWTRESESWLRQMLGDKTLWGIIVPRNTSLEERLWLRAEFPEARSGIVYRANELKSLEEFPDDPNPRSAIRL